MASGKYVIPTKEETLQGASTEVNNLVLFNRRVTQRKTQRGAEYLSLCNSAPHSAKLCGFTNAKKTPGSC